MTVEATEPPECGFIERPDGSIVWGSTWEPSDGPEPICIEYHLEECGAWVPFSTWTKDEEFDICESCYQRQPAERADPKRCTSCGKKGKIATRKCIDLHDCDWIAKEATLYHHESGGNADGMPYVNAYAEPDKVPGRIWIAEGVIVVDGWEPGKVRRKKTPLTDTALLAMGYRRVHGPTPDPFAGGIEGDTFYDERSGERYPDEDGGQCCCCDEQFVSREGDIVAVVQYGDLDDDENEGLYRTLNRWDRLWVAPPPHDMHHAHEWSDDVCPKCAALTISDFTIHGLVIAWCEDAEAMHDEHREALLDAVRERVDKWIAGYPERREPEVHNWFVKDMSERLGVQPTEMRMLFDEAGYPG